MKGTDKERDFMLVADSNIDDRFQTGMILQQYGYAVFTADNAEQALAIMSATPPAAVFTDAGEIGMAILAGMKSSPFTADIPLIVASSTANAMLEGRMRRGLIAGVLVRPLTVEKLFRVVESVVVKGSRRNIRAAVTLRAGLSGEHGILEGLVTAISEYGMFFRTLDSLSARTRVKARLEIEGRPVLADAEVVYQCNLDEGPYKEPGMGVKFLKVSPEDQEVIKAFVQEVVDTKGVDRVA